MEGKRELPVESSSDWRWMWRRWNGTLLIILEIL